MASSHYRVLFLYFQRAIVEAATRMMPAVRMTDFDISIIIQNTLEIENYPTLSVNTLARSEPSSAEQQK